MFGPVMAAGSSCRPLLTTGKEESRSWIRTHNDSQGACRAAYKIRYRYVSVTKAFTYHLWRPIQECRTKVVDAIVRHSRAFKRKARDLNS